MVKGKYENMVEKLESLLEKHELVYYWDTSIKDITLTVRPAQVESEQTSFIEDSEDGKSSSDAAISFIFKDGAVIINTVGKLFISESLINKLKNIAKKMHYLYLQTLWEERADGGCVFASKEEPEDEPDPEDEEASEDYEEVCPEDFTDDQF